MYKYIKRCFDFISALLLFIVISPFYLVLYILVAVKLGKPVYFKQKRTGKDGRVFEIKKFRSMTEQKDENGNYLPDDVRLTKFGRFLRSTSLDELPELLCIIKGDMSVIGPRPLPPTYDEYYTEKEKARFKVRSGLIPPEVLFNNVQPTWEEQLEYEAWYAENVSFVTDIKIMFSVFKGIFKRYDNNYGEYVRPDLAEERRKKEEVSVNGSVDPST